MLPAKLLYQLGAILADLYTDAESARRVVSDAGIDDRFVAFRAKAIDNWHAILEEAQKQPAQVNELLQIAQSEYPDNQPLQEVLAAYWEQQAQSDPTLEALLTTYLRQVVENTASLLLPGLARQPNGRPTIVRLELAEIYTGLDTLHLQEATTASAVPQRQSALDFVNQQPYSVLLGDPGSGKSMFANLLALCLAGEHLHLADTNLARLGPEWTHGALWPLYIPARRLVEQTTKSKRQPLADHLWYDLVHTIGLQRADDAARFAQQLATEGGMVLIDGFDEIPVEQQQRLDLPAAIQALRQRFPTMRILLTSRTYAYPQIQAELPEFATATIAPFSAGQIAAFIQQWHRPGVAPVGSNVDLGQLADRLQRLLGAYPALQELAARPLLLTLLTTLHTLQPATLPTNQVQIFEESIDWLLTVWEDSKPLLSKSRRLQLSHAEARDVMEQLAYIAQTRQHTLQEAADLMEKEIAHTLIDVAYSPKLRLAEVVDYIRSRTGLLRERSPQLYSFPHRAIQEYLAACYLLSTTERRAELVALTSRAPEHWREVLLWAGRTLAEAEPAALWSLTSQLYSTATTQSPPQWLLFALAGRILAEAHVTQNVALNAEQNGLLQRLRQELVQIIRAEQWPLAERVSAGATLGHLGDPRPGVGIEATGRLPALDWVLIEAGPFLLGSEPPVLCTQLKQPYQISRYPITVAQYQTFVAAGGYTQRQWWTTAGWSWRKQGGITAPRVYDAIFQTPNHPQVGVSWYEAVAFCRWLAAQLEQRIELPSEFQWERAARHVDGRLYPWGNEFAAQHCNARPTGLGATTPVGLFTSGTAVCGAADLAGNVWEWCRTEWCSQLQAYTPAADLNLEGVERRALRGGSFGNPPRFVRCANRERNYPLHSAHNVGFRVVLAAGA